MRHLGSGDPSAHPQARRGGSHSRQPADRGSQGDGLRRLRLYQHHAQGSAVAGPYGRGAEEGGRNRRMPLHHRQGEHPGETLLRGQRAPDAHDLRRDPPHPGNLHHGDEHLAAGGFPARGQHRLHRGVSPGSFASGASAPSGTQTARGERIRSPLAVFCVSECAFPPSFGLTTPCPATSRPRASRVSHPSNCGPSRRGRGAPAR